MIIRVASVVLASVFFGVRVHGSLNLMHKRATPPQNFSLSFTQDPQVYLNSSSVVQYSINTTETIQGLAIILCQTSAWNPSTFINSTNAWEIVQLFSNICINGIGGQDCLAPANNDTGPIDANIEVSSIIQLSPGPRFDRENLSNFFLCFAQNPVPTPICNAYSPLFDLKDPAVSQTSSAPVQLPRIFASSSMSITQTNSNVLSVASSAIFNNVGSITTSPPTTPASTSLVYVSTPTSTTYVATTTIPPVPASTSTVALTQPKRKLSTGARIGIIVGAVGGALVLALLTLLCIRRRRHIRATRPNTLDSNQTENVLLTQNFTSVVSKDAMPEKDYPATLAAMFGSTLSGPSFRRNPRHSYDSISASAPYAGRAAAVPNPIGHSSQNSQSQDQPHPPHHLSLFSHSNYSTSRASGLSDTSGPLTRGFSNASPPLSPRTVSTVRSDREDFESYHDMPIYGDARRTPTVYDTHPSLVQVEEGMSAEEIARLEEEERRIDAAIAAAEDENRRR